MNEPIQMRVPTSSLRKFLEDQPALILQLESMAAEKIAEEIMRKVTKADIKPKVDAMVNKIIGDAQRALSSKYSFPDAGRKVVHELVLESLKAAREHAIKEFRGDLADLWKVHLDNSTKELSRQMDSLMNEARQALVGMIHEQARATFIDVLKEAKAGL